MIAAKRILHVVPDDKFIDIAIRQFEGAIPNLHRYFAVDVAKPFGYVKSSRVLDLSYRDYEKEIQKPEVAAIVFHSMPESHYCLLDLVPEGKKVIWLGWGFDYYNFLEPAYPHGFVLPGTAKRSAPTLAKRVYRYGKFSTKKIVTAVGLRRNTDVEKALARVDYFSPVLDSEFSLFSQLNSWFQAEYVSWNYGTVEDDFAVPSTNMNGLGDNVLIGNSATPTSNHYEAFLLVKSQIELMDRKVVVPLSYGDSNYRDTIIQCGREIFGDNFTPLIEFEPSDKYIQRLNSCGLVMMNHIRQQALGNICISALLGARIFLNAKSPLTSWLQQKGLVIGDIENLNDEPLGNQDRLRNSEAIKAHWGRGAQLERTRNLIAVALS